jgi:hypothetical protein
MGSFMNEKIVFEESNVISLRTAYVSENSSHPGAGHDGQPGDAPGEDCHHWRIGMVRRNG